MSVWKFKSGQRESASETLKKITEKARKTDGFRGHVYLLSRDDPDSETVVSLWEDEEALRASAQGLFQEATRDLGPYITGPPDMKTFRVEMAEVQRITPEMARPI